MLNFFPARTAATFRAVMLVLGVTAQAQDASEMPQHCDTLSPPTYRIVSELRGTDGPPALIVGLHGYGSDERQIATLVSVSLPFPHVYVALRGPCSVRTGGFAWYPVALTTEGPTVQSEEIEESTVWLSQTLHLLARTLSADADDVHLVGYSQGGGMALAMALSASDTIRSVASFAGDLPADFEMHRPTRPLSILVAHGTQDPLISAQEIDDSRALLAQHGHSVTAFDEPVPHIIGNAGRAALQHWLTGQVSRPK